jgi:hypothetical protein
VFTKVLPETSACPFAEMAPHLPALVFTKVEPALIVTQLPEMAPPGAAPPLVLVFVKLLPETVTLPPLVLMAPPDASPATVSVKLLSETATLRP